MRRADRLFQIIQLLRRGRVVTAEKLAAQLEVSERTIYRDLKDLIESGTPIDGERGVGYRLRPSYDLPPLMFEQEEIEALVLGARIVAAFADPRLAKSSRAVLSKVESVLPKSRRRALRNIALFAIDFDRAVEPTGPALGGVRRAIVDRVKLSIDYERIDGRRGIRVVRPLAAFFWGKAWTLTAWCEKRDDFRNFRIDRIHTIARTPARFTDETGKTLRDYLMTLRGGMLELIDDQRPAPAAHRAPEADVARSGLVSFAQPSCRLH